MAIASNPSDGQSFHIGSGLPSLISPVAVKAANHWERSMVSCHRWRNHRTRPQWPHAGAHEAFLHVRCGFAREVGTEEAGSSGQGCRLRGVIGYVRPPMAIFFLEPRDPISDLSPLWLGVRSGVFCRPVLQNS
jgi:hypothetical protein